MTASLLTPDLRRILADIQNRLGILERRINSRGASIDDSHEIIFSYPGTLVVSTSPPVRIRRGGNLAVLAVTFTTAGSTATTLLVQRNGSTVATVTVPASTTIYNAEVSARYAADVDTLSLAINTAGTGAANMTAEARFT